MLCFDYIQTEINLVADKGSITRILGVSARKLQVHESLKEFSQLVYPSVEKKKRLKFQSELNCYLFPLGVVYDLTFHQLSQK